MVPQPAVVVTATSSPPSAAVAAQCQNECSIQCEHQCGIHSLAGPQCLAACQVTRPPFPLSCPPSDDVLPRLPSQAEAKKTHAAHNDPGEVKMNMKYLFCVVLRA